MEMETTARFDPRSDEFELTTPGPLAQKYWITNSAVHAHWAVVFARLILPDGALICLVDFSVFIKLLGCAIKSLIYSRIRLRPVISL